MVSPMSKRRCGVGVAVLNDLLYAVGGKHKLPHAHTLYSVYNSYNNAKIIVSKGMMVRAI